MQVAKHLWAAVAAVMAGPLLAHPHLQQAEPAEGSQLARAPQELALSFSEPARLIVLAVARDQGAAQKITALPATPQKRVVVSLPALSAGKYEITWRVIGTDGHVVPGALHFTLTQ
jgi:methionine-rich copper-binding protein CopC